MKFFILTFFCNLLSSGYLQETNNFDDYNLAHPDASKNDWPTQNFHTIQGNFYGQTHRSDSKPCSRRSTTEDEPISQQLSLPLSSKVQTITSAAIPLKPQALRNAEHEPKTTIKQVSLPNAQPITDTNDLYKTRNSLTITNPVIDSGEESHREVIPITNNEIQEDNLKPSAQMRSAPTSNTLSQSSSAVKSATNKKDDVQTKSFVPDTEYGAQPDNHYVVESSNTIASEPNRLRSSPDINMPPTDNIEYPGFSANIVPLETQTLPPAIVAQFLAHRKEALPSKCSHDQEPNNLIGHSRRSMSNDNNDNANDISRNDKESLQNNNERYIKSHTENENALASVLNAEKNTPKPNKVQSLRILDTAKMPSISKKPVLRARPSFNEARREMIEPTKGAGVMGQSALMLMQSERICYACSTANNPSCWSPDRRTTVKYCRKGNNACITKTFGQGSSFTLIRDCGRSCDDSDSTSIMPKYKSCSMCHSELCNGAYSIVTKSHNMIFAIILTAAIKYLN